MTGLMATLARWLRPAALTSDEIDILRGAAGGAAAR